MMIEINNLSYKGILNQISFTIEDGDYLAIIGENGSGKTTLINCIIGINEVAHNSILIDGKCISCYRKFSQIGFVSQINKTIYELPISVSEIFYLVSDDRDKINSLMRLFSISDLKDMNINKLSGGQRQKVNIVKALLNDIDYLILDEPETGLDSKSRKDLQSVLKMLNGNGITIIVISHYLNEDMDSLKAVYNLDEKEFKRIANV